MAYLFRELAKNRIGKVERMTKGNVLFTPAFRPKCYGCEACRNVCSRQAISMRADAEGFLIPVLDEAKCTQCRMCEKACPALNTAANNCTDVPTAFAAKNTNEQIRLDSSSGGIFTAVALEILGKGGVVYGAAFDEVLELRHIGVESEVGLGRLRGSKYLQSRIGESYFEIKGWLKAGREVLFSGTPCQVAGLYSFLGKLAPQHLVTIDLICHGVPSPRVFHKYIHEEEAVIGDRIREIEFRDKVKGWKYYSMKRVFKHEGASSDKSTSYVTLDKDLFMRVFLQNLCLRPSCHTCQYAKFPRIADITLADYWGVEKVHPEFDDDRGVSLVLLNSAKALQVWSGLEGKVEVIKTNLKTAIGFNPSVYKPSVPSEYRDEFFRNLNQFDLKELVRKYCKKRSIYKRIAERLKKVFIQ